jgi:hypothetical protein
MKAWPELSDEFHFQTFKVDEEVKSVSDMDHGLKGIMAVAIPSSQMDGDTGQN